MVVLEDDEYDYDPEDPSQLDRFGRAMLHGKGCDRWYDKSFNVIVMKNGRVSPHEFVILFHCMYYRWTMVTNPSLTIVYSEHWPFAVRMLTSASWRVSGICDDVYVGIIIIYCFTCC